MRSNNNRSKRIPMTGRSDCSTRDISPYLIEKVVLLRGNRLSSVNNSDVDVKLHCSLFFLSRFFSCDNIIVRKEMFSILMHVMEQINLFRLTIISFPSRAKNVLPI